MTDVMPVAECGRILQVIDDRARTSPGSRALLDIAPIRELARSILAHPKASALLPANAVAVQCTLFAKNEGVNWSVAPHQDLSIPVAARFDASVCTGWSKKEGTWFVQPSSDVLGALVALRIQLDTPSPDAGPLRVVPGSHRSGRVVAADIPSKFPPSSFRQCLAPQGGAIAMKPLLVHSSAKAIGKLPRRVLHFLFGPALLPGGLEWSEKVCA